MLQSSKVCNAFDKLGYAGQIFIISRIVLEAVIETKILTLIFSDELNGVKSAVMVFV